MHLTQTSCNECIRRIHMMELREETSFCLKKIQGCIDEKNSMLKLIKNDDSHHFVIYFEFRCE